MPSPKIRSDYEQLKQMAQRFGQQADQHAALHTQLNSQVQILQGGDWIGQGASAFYQEMTGQVLPSLKRLGAAMGRAREVTLLILNTMQMAEQAAANVLKGDGQPGTGNSTGPSPATTIGNGAASGAAGGAAGSASATTKSNVPTGPDTSGPFKVGPPQRPDIKHDNGFLDKFKPESPSVEDYVQLAEWRALLEGSKLATKLGIKNLDDANDAYEHFLDGNGKDRKFSFDEYVKEDKSGKLTLENTIKDAQKHAEIIGQGRTDFQITSNPYSAGGNDKLNPDTARFPYPTTENWQKAIGAYKFWTSSDVHVEMGADGKRHYRMEVTLHAEDRYNFNPGAADIATGVADSANGRFEITGLAKQYMNYGESKRVVEWVEGDGTSPTLSEPDVSRRDNRGERMGRGSERGDRPAPRDVTTPGDRSRPPLPKP